jgi:hypothetical protein
MLGTDFNIAYGSIAQLRYDTSKLTLPVSPNDMLYANFKYVTGIAANDGARYPVSRLWILDSLISKLVEVQGYPQKQKYRK